jgi:hypothetical protein
VYRLHSPEEKKFHAAPTSKKLASVYQMSLQCIPKDGSTTDCSPVTDEPQYRAGPTISTAASDPLLIHCCLKCS